MTAAAPRTYDPRECKALTFHDATPREIIARVHGETVKALASAEVKQETKKSLWDQWPMFFLIVGMMTIEWFLRKRWGLV